MSQPYVNYYGYYLYYDGNNYNDNKDAFNYLGKLDASQIKTFFDAAKIDGEANFKTNYGSDYKIVYDHSSKCHMLLKR